MSSITDQPENSSARRRSLQLLSGYVALATAAALWRMMTGTGSGVSIAAYAVVGVGLAFAFRARSGTGVVVADWLPLLALPLLYAAIPGSIVHADGRMFDATLQVWDRALFGTDPARTLAGALPNVVLSEVLHAAYLSYYIIIYLPPLLLALRGEVEGFQRTVLAFTVTMIACFVVFCVFPVEGPRYAWPAPAGVPEGPMRAVVLALLEGGSSRGTAFPSSHLAIATTMSLSSMVWRLRLWPVIAGASVLLGVGAVYGGFHYAADMIAGAGVGVAGWVTGRGVVGSKS